MGLDVAGIITLMLTVISVGAAVGAFAHAAIRKLSGEMKELRGEMKELRGEMKGLEERLRGEIHSVRDELRGEIRGVRDELRDELRGEIAGVRTELRAVEGRQTGRVTRLEDKVFGVPLQDPATGPA